MIVSSYCLNVRVLPARDASAISANTLGNAMHLLRPSEPAQYEEQLQQSAAGEPQTQRSVTLRWKKSPDGQDPYLNTLLREKCTWWLVDIKNERGQWVQVGTTKWPCTMTATSTNNEIIVRYEKIQPGF